MKNEKLLYNFVYYWKSLYDNGVFFGYEGKTSGIKNLLFDSFVNSYYTVVPDAGVVNQFYDIMENIQNKKQKYVSAFSHMSLFKRFKQLSIYLSVGSNDCCILLA